MQSDEKKDGWHSWDESPWAHPWLTTENLERVKAFSDQFYDTIGESSYTEPGRVAFVGNIANSMFTRAEPLRKRGMDIDLYLHPGSTDVLADPGWEYYEKTVPPGLDWRNAGEFEMPFFDWVFRKEMDDDCANACAKPLGRKIFRLRNRFLPEGTVEEFPEYLPYIRTLQALQKYDALWSTQCPYLAYLSGRPYMVSQMGGDLWVEASRGDNLGIIMRRSFEKAKVCVFSNPWSLSHARRYGFRHFVYLPKILDESVYCPGEGNSRAEWEKSSGGDFFILTSSRLDAKNKGSNLVIDAFARFSREHPGARLAIIGWGNDREKVTAQLSECGIADKVLLLPFSGKALIRDYLRSCDVMLDQFVLGYFGGAGLEAMACGKPVMGRIEREQYDAICATGAPPILNAGTADEILEHLIRLCKDPGYCAEVGKRTRQWFLENHSAEAASSRHASVLSYVRGREHFDFSQSPLSLPPGQKEQEYYRENLRKAPTFPNYGW